MDRVSEIGFFLLRNQCEKWVERNLNKAFLDFLPFLMTFLELLHFEKSSKMAKGQENLCSVCLQPITYFKGHFQNLNPNFWKPGRSLVSTSDGIFFRSK